MSRAARLLDLMQLLRRHRRPVAGAALAAELGISLRTLYRDIATLQAHGARIDGEAGVGYLLRPGFLLPPLMLGEDELEALVLGARWVSAQPDAALASAARDVVAKIAAVLPPELREQLDTQALLVPSRAPAGPDLGPLRTAIRTGQKLRLAYRDANGSASERTVWPVALGFFESSRVLAAWCETRGDFRHFRTDRMQGVTLLEERVPERRGVLLRRWREQHGVEVGSL